jgi:lysophospholipase L1-like esterase
MKKILCYGDSNTFGFIPKTCGRYEKSERWSGMLSELLPNYEIIEEGMNNRTGFFTNPEGLKQSGGDYLSVYLQNHKDIDICILSLGTNDAQIFYNLDEESIRKGLQRLIDTVHETNLRTEVVILPPVRIMPYILNSGFSMMFDQESIKRNHNTLSVFEQVAKENGCEFFDVNEIVTPSEADGLHYTKESHKLIAQHLAEFMKTVSVLPRIL